MAREISVAMFARSMNCDHALALMDNGTCRNQKHVLSLFILSFLFIRLWLKNVSNQLCAEWIGLVFVERRSPNCMAKDCQHSQDTNSFTGRTAGNNFIRSKREIHSHYLNDEALFLSQNLLVDLSIFVYFSIFYLWRIPHVIQFNRHHVRAAFALCRLADKPSIGFYPCFADTCSEYTPGGAPQKLDSTVSYLHICISVKTGQITLSLFQLVSAGSRCWLLVEPAGSNRYNESNQFTILLFLYSSN